MVGFPKSKKRWYIKRETHTSQSFLAGDAPYLVPGQSLEKSSILPGGRLFGNFCQFVIEEWQCTLDPGKCVHALFLNGLKAFDRVDHALLRNKLYSPSLQDPLLKPLKWMKSYLQAYRVGLHAQANFSAPTFEPAHEARAGRRAAISVNLSQLQLRCSNSITGPQASSSRSELSAKWAAKNVIAFCWADRNLSSKILARYIQSKKRKSKVLRRS